MPYAVSLRPGAARSLAKLPREAQHHIGHAIDGLAETPRPSGARKLRGGSELLRIRVGRYRVLYSVDDRACEVLVTRIAHRREVYR